MTTTLEEWLSTVLQRPSVTNEALSFYELDDPPSKSGTVEALVDYGVSALERLDEAMSRLGGRPPGWIPFVQMELERTERPLLELVTRSTLVGDLTQASIGLAKDGQLIYWGSWVAHQISAMLDELGKDGYRLIQHSWLNERDFEYSWDTYRNRVFIVRSATLYE
jgi:hypothetical protein